jgi:hypothetical protein
LAGVGATLAMPVAHADPLDGIRAAVNGVRAGSVCGALTYSGQLEAAAQGYARNRADQDLHGYPGTARLVSFKEDPTAEAIDALVTENEYSIKDCKYKDFGVGMTRVDDDENSVVSIALGEPAPAPAQQVPPQQAPPQADNRSTICTETGVIVPAGEKCPARPVTPATPPVTNAIQASFGDTTLTTIELNVTNTSNLNARCDYVATTNSLNPVVPKRTTRTFDVPANGNHTERFDGAVTLSTYQVTLSCTDASGTQKEPLGNAQLSVTW